jgi:hypothetical protein
MVMSLVGIGTKNHCTGEDQQQFTELDCVSPFVARERLGKYVPGATKNCWRRRFQCGPCRIKESRRLVLPKTSWFLFVLQAPPIALYFVALIVLVTSENDWSYSVLGHCVEWSP